MTTQDNLPSTVVDLARRIEHAWANLLSTLARLTEAQMEIPDAGGWSAKDNLIHLTAWEQYMVHYHIRHRPAHEVMQVDEATLKASSEEALNAIIQKRNHSRSVSEVVSDLHRSHREVLTTLQDLSYADLMQPRFPDDPEARPLIGWIIGNTYAHYEEHGANIQKLADQLAAQSR